MKFENKVVVVTGSATGIGKAVAEAFSQEGAKVVVNSKSNAIEGQAVVDRIINQGGDAYYIQGDLSKEDIVKNFFKEVIIKYHTIDVLINNAGRTVPQEIENATSEHWLNSINDNLLSTVFCSKEVIEIMKKHGNGSIINTSSVRGLENTGREGIMAYSASKAAVNNFTKTLAKKLAPLITVNAIAPGFVHTPYMDTISTEIKNNWLKSIPIKRFITTEELANAYLFLASAPYITGSILVTDGGFSLKIA